MSFYNEFHLHIIWLIQYGIDFLLKFFINVLQEIEQNQLTQIQFGAKQDKILAYKVGVVTTSDIGRDVNKVMLIN